MKPHNLPGTRNRLIFSTAFTLVLFFLQLAGGLWTGSLALVSDSAHVFMDAFSLGLSLLALVLSSRPPDDRHTYGYHRVEVLAALINGISLAFISLGIFYEAYLRLLDPVSVRGTGMLIIAILGLAANVIVALTLNSSHDAEGHNHMHHDLNLSSAFLHVVGDAVSSVGVIIAAVIIQITGILWVDPLVSVLIAILILFGSYRVLRPTLHILIEGTPEGLSAGSVRDLISSMPTVQGVHDLHLWNICSGHIALSAHVVVPFAGQADQDDMMAALKERLVSQFGIEHTTIQFEAAPCGQIDQYCL